MRKVVACEESAVSVQSDHPEKNSEKRQNKKQRALRKRVCLRHLKLHKVECSGTAFAAPYPHRPAPFMCLKISLLRRSRIRKARPGTAISLGASLLSAPFLLAATWTWQGINGTWNDPSKWRDDL